MKEIRIFLLPVFLSFQVSGREGLVFLRKFLILKKKGKPWQKTAEGLACGKLWMAGGWRLSR
jgi:hypothetical protein